MAEFLPLAKNSPFLAGYERPEAMAIGDSIFNGVRSATINGGMARWSPPAQLARDRGWPMRLPDYRRPVLFDLEREVREGVDLKRLRDRILENADRWIEERGEWSAQTFFDNVSIAGAVYGDLHDATAGHARAQIPFLLERLRNSRDLDFAAAAQLWFFLNMAFLLNPSGHPELDDLTPLEQVASRKPKRLFINIGSNEGLFRIGITANYSRANREQIARIPDLAKTLAEALDAHCKDVERIYFNLLVRPRTLGNLAPREDADMYEYPGAGYFDRYVGRLAMQNGMTGDQMKDFDKEIDKVNDATRKAMTAVLGDRIRFVDTYKTSTAADGKHYGNARMVEVEAGASRYRLSNMPFAAGPFGFRQGGLFGLDNMHPTSVGYALLAEAMAKEVVAGEGGSKPAISPQSAFDADALLQDPPRSWDALNFLLGLIADLTHTRVGL